MTVLIVDDEPLIRRSLAKAFLASQHEVFEAEDGLRGLDLWTRQKPDVVFVDVLMPGMTGPQLVQAVSPAIRAKTKIILMSAFTGGEGSRHELTEKVDLFLAKPFDDIFKVVKMAEAVLGSK